MKSLNDYIYEVLVKQHATKDTVVIYRMELKKIPKTRKAFIEVFKKFANYIHFTEIVHDSWYKHGQPDANTFSVGADDRSIDFYFSEGRVIRITSYLSGARSRTNTLKIKALVINREGYPSSSDYDINLLDGAEWDFINKDKNKYNYSGNSFNPAELEPIQVEQIINGLFDILNYKCVNRIFSKFFRFKNNKYVRSTGSTDIQYSDICEVKGKVFKYKMKFKDFLQNALHNTEWMEFRKDGFDTKDFLLSSYENNITEDNMHKVFNSLKEKSVDIDIYKTDKRYNHITVCVNTDEYMFYYSCYESTNDTAYNLFNDFVKNYK